MFKQQDLHMFGVNFTLLKLWVVVEGENLNYLIERFKG